MEYGETIFADMTEDELQNFVSPYDMVAPKEIDSASYTVITPESIRERMAKDKRRGNVKSSLNIKIIHDYIVTHSLKI